MFLHSLSRALQAGLIHSIDCLSFCLNTSVSTLHSGLGIFWHINGNVYTSKEDHFDQKIIIFLLNAATLKEFAPCWIKFSPLMLAIFAKGSKSFPLMLATFEKESNFSPLEINPSLPCKNSHI